MKGLDVMKKDGQALVEFIIIMPIFIMLVLGMIDLGKIMQAKIAMEEELSEVISLYQEGKTVLEIENKFDDVELEINTSDNYVDYQIKKNIEIMTPGLNLIFHNPYELEVSRSIYNDFE